MRQSGSAVICVDGVQLDRGDETYVDERVRRGRYASSAEAVHDGLRALKARDAKLATLRGQVDRANAEGGDLTSEDVLENVRATLERPAGDPQLTG